MMHVITKPPAEFRLKRFTVVEYDQMIRDGTIDGKPLELLDGWIVEKMPHNPAHDSAISRLTKRLLRILGDDYLVRVQCSADVDTSVPEPDIAIVPGPEDRYDEQRPQPSDLLIVIEVSESSLVQDRGFKQRLYARNKIAEYWIVNLQERIVEIYTQPRGGRNPAYRSRVDYVTGSTVPVIVAGKTVGTIPASEILP